MNRVFISYSRQNVTFVERLARDLSDAGLFVWVDFRHIKGGDDWRKAITDGINQSEILLVCLSPDAVKSEWVRREIFLARSQHKFIIPLMVSPCIEMMAGYDETEELLDIQYVDFDKQTYEQAFPALLRAIPNLIQVEETSDSSSLPSPFKGLEAFQETDSGVFFGREDLIQKMLNRLHLQLADPDASRFLGVVGASGSGKSSVVRAGFVPAIRAGKLPGSDQWRIVIFTPGENPLTTLATRLLPLFESNPPPLEEVISSLEKDPTILARLVKRLLGNSSSNNRLVLVIDQFEEVFTRASQYARETFLDALHYAVTVNRGQAMVIITLRADFFDRLSSYPAIAQLFENDNMVIAAEMSVENLRRSIEAPASAVGLVYEQGLTDRILTEVNQQPGSLPLLQFALQALFEQRSGRRLTLAAYESIGGVRRALAQHAENIFNEMPETQQVIMRRLLLRLIEVSESGEATRRKVKRDDLTFRDTLSETIYEVIEILSEAKTRLLVTSREIKSAQSDDREPAIWVEISHEALIREWERFKNWIADDLESLRLGSDILKSAQDWQRAGQDSAYLLTGNRLVQAEVWLNKADPSDLQRDFIQTSQEIRQKRQAAGRKQQEQQVQLQTQAAEKAREAARRLRYLVAALLIFSVSAVALMLFALDASDKAQQEAQNAQVARQTSEVNVTLAIEAKATSDMNESIASTAVADALQQAQTIQTRRLAESANRLLQSGEPLKAINLFLEANQLERLNAEDETALASAVYYGPVNSFSLNHFIVSTALSMDGKLLAAGGSLYMGNNDNIDSPPVLSLWDTSTGELSREIDVSEEYQFIDNLAFSLDGQYLAGSNGAQSILVWNVHSGELIHRFMGHTDEISNLAFHPDSKHIASTAYDGTLILWDLKTQQSVYRVNPQAGGLVAVAFTSDGDEMIIAGDQVMQLETESGKILNAWGTGEHENGIQNMALSPDGTRLATIDNSPQILLWDVATRSQILEMQHTETLFIDTVDQLDFSPDGRYLLASEAQLTREEGGQQLFFMWSTTTGGLIRHFEGSQGIVLSIAFHPHGKTFFVQTLSFFDEPPSRVREWRIAPPHQLQEWWLDKDFTAGLRFQEDGSNIIVHSAEGRIEGWNINTGAIVTTPDSTGASYGNGWAFSPDGQVAIYNDGYSSTLELRNATTGEIIREVGDDDVYGKPVAFSSDGQIGAYVAMDGVTLFNINSGEIIRRLNDSSGFAAFRADNGIAISADGLTLLTTGVYGGAALWDTSTGNLQRVITDSNLITSAPAFSPDGRWVTVSTAHYNEDEESIAGPYTLYLINRRTGETIRSYEGHSDWILFSAFSPDSSRVASLDGNGMLIVWEVDSLEMLLYRATNQHRIPELTCEERISYGLTACGEELASLPTRTPYPTPYPSATATITNTPDPDLITTTMTLTPSETPYTFDLSNPTPAPGPFIATAPVVIALQDLPRGFRLTEEFISSPSPAIGIAFFPLDSVPPGSFQAVEQLLNFIVTTDIPRESVILRTQIYSDALAGGNLRLTFTPTPFDTSTPANLTSQLTPFPTIPVTVASIATTTVTASPTTQYSFPLSYLIDEGNVEYVLPLSSQVRILPGLSEGDYIDLFITVNAGNAPQTSTQKRVERAKVLRIGTENISIAIDSQDVTVLTNYLNNGAKITVGLWSVNDAGTVPTNEITLQYLVEYLDMNVPANADFNQIGK